jgi:hypothetical protein
MSQPVRGTVYSLSEVNTLDLLDSPFLGFEYNGARFTIQNQWGISPEMEVAAANTQWRYQRTTDEWCPLFECADVEALLPHVEAYVVDAEVYVVWKGTACCGWNCEQAVLVALPDAAKTVEDAERAHSEATCTCPNCRRDVQRQDLREWRWYDFYAAQGDIPMKLCAHCWSEPGHKDRMERDRRAYNSEMGHNSDGHDDDAEWDDDLYDLDSDPTGIFKD